MKPLPMLCITSEHECLVEVNSEPAGVVGAGRHAVLPIAETVDCFVSLLPLVCERSGYALPVTRRLRFEGGVLEAGSVADDVRITVWGNMFEVCLSPVIIPMPAQRGAKSFGSIRFASHTGAVTVELIWDSGLRLVVTPAGEGVPFAFDIGEGNSGTLASLDVGRERLLAVSITADIGERLLLLDPSFDTLLDVSGATAGIYDGYPTVTDGDGLSCYRRRTRYEYRAGSFTALADEFAPMANESIALRFCEAALLKRFDEALALLSDDLGLDASDISDFLGEFKFCRYAPSCSSAGSDIVGLFEQEQTVMRPRLMRFELSNELITDIEEIC